MKILLFFLPIVQCFDYFVFSQTWVPEFCNLHHCQGQENFIIHGLWPQYQNNTYPSFCYPCEEFNKNLLDENLIQKYWADNPNNFGMINTQEIDWNFIKHEWVKHGCCSGLSQKDYFNHALSLREKWDFKRVFESVEIYPNKTYSKDLLISVARDFCGNKCNIVLQCIKNNLIEIWITFNKNLDVIFQNVDGNCMNEVYF